MPELRRACEEDPAHFGGDALGPPRPALPGTMPKNLIPPRPMPPPSSNSPEEMRPPEGMSGGLPPPNARPATLFAYDASMHSQNANAPQIPGWIGAPILQDNGSISSRDLTSSEVIMLVQMPWREGPCAVVLARGTTDPAWGALLPESNAWLLPPLAIFAAMLLAAGPFVRRVQKLTRDVESAEAHNYEDRIALTGDDEVADLARAFDKAGREIRGRLVERDARESALREFLASTTHDVMLPLTVLSGHLASLREKTSRGEAIDPEVLVSAMDEAHYMASLIRDLSVTARLDAAAAHGADSVTGGGPRESGHASNAAVVKTEVDLGALVGRVIARHRPIAKEHGVAIESAVPATPLVVIANETLLEQAVSNVVYNAVRYNERGGHVSVTLEDTRVGAERTPGDARFVLEVKDDGHGVSDEELAHLSERGFRGKEARSRRPDGQGLGLAIAFRAVKLHGYEMTFSRAEEGGLSVTISTNGVPASFSRRRRRRARRERDETPAHTRTRNVRLGALRRFELSEGVSSKFWQIDVAGKSFTVAWGRLGTSGQTQTKAFDSDEKASAEHDKLVKEKLKKGYAEVPGLEAAAAATPTSTTRSPSPSPSPSTTTSPSPSTTASASPTTSPSPKATKASPTPSSTAPATAVSSPTSSPTGPANSPSTAPSPATPRSSPITTLIDFASPIYQRAAPVPASGRAFHARADTFALLRDRWKLVETGADGAPKPTGALATMLDAVKAAYSADAPRALDPRVEGAAYVLLSRPVARGLDYLGAAIAHHWISHGSGELAIRALAASADFADAAATLTTWGSIDDAWLVIRGFLASVDAPEYARLLTLANELREQMPIRARAVFDAAIGHPASAQEDVTELLQTHATAYHAPLILWPVLFSLDDPDAILAGLDALTLTWSKASSYARLADVLVRCGERAVPLLIKIAGDAAKNGHGADHIREVASMLALVKNDEAARYFTRSLDDKTIRAIATEYLQSAPSLALVPLIEQAVQKGAGADLAKTVLVSVVAKARVEAKAIVSSLPPAQKLVLAAALERFENVPDADASEVPRVLADPPWLSKKASAEPKVVEGLIPKKRDPQIHWKDAAQKAEVENARSMYKVDPAASSAILSSIADATAHQKESSIRCTVVLALPKKESLDVIANTPLHVFSWYFGGVPSMLLGRYEKDAIPAVLRIAAVDPVNGVEALAVVDAESVAALMADAYTRLKSLRKVAQLWLFSYPETAARGLIPTAVGPIGKARTAAENALRYLASVGKTNAIEGAAAAYGADASAALDALLKYDPLYDFPFPVKMPKLPAFFSPEGLPRLRLSQGRKKALSISGMTALGTLLAGGGLSPVLADHFKQVFTRDSLSEFCWELFQAWTVAGAPAREQWAFIAMGLLGDDACARKLTPLVRAWPGEAAHARAVLGLDVLAAIGTDVALMHLHGISQKLKFKGLQEKAGEKITEIADARGLTKEELADRLVPDLGLDDDGSRMLDFGERRFRVQFDETLKPVVVDDAGKRLPDLPKPKQTDDAEKAKEATDIWKALKKDAKAVAQSQLIRLEIAMCGGRRWPVDVWETFLRDHPLLIHLVRRVVWGAYDAAGKLRSTFRVAEDSSLADCKDAAYAIPGDASIGLVHRLDLSEADAQAWGQLFGDYEIMQPFEQLSREVLTANPDEAGTAALHRVEGVVAPTGKVLGLDARGWRRGAPQDGGVVCWYEKRLGGNLVACLDLDPGIFTGMISESPEQKLGACTVALDGNMWAKDRHRNVEELSRVELSELLRDLESLRA